MSFFDFLCSLIAPHICIGCRFEGTLLCPDCRKKLKFAESVCYNCNKTTKNHQTCLDCLAESGLRVVYPTTSYDDIAKDLIWRLKFTGAIAAAKVMAELMAKGYAPPSSTIIVPVPTATGRARQRGYDQAVILAKAYASAAGCEYLNCLRRLGQIRQRGADRSARKQQLEGLYRVVKSKHLLNRDVLLIDDVTTTGATLEVATKILRKAGAKSVQAVVFAKA